ncbi:MAG: excinuclease ABC subunit UvrC [Flavobacteriales bacterium]|nr:excinuclease ABC subunit UvrC [Flavobacteriales bacterium]
MTEHLELILKTIPTDPGVYRYFDSEGKILYVGKAKSLKNRVLSYFTGTGHSVKTRVMVSKIADVKFIVVQSEADALLLENNLIKTLRPRYNIMLKDDKTYPWICIKKERFPRIFLTRKKVNDGSEYFGPYPAVGTAHLLLDILRDLFPLRTCKAELSEKNIDEGRIKPCLEYHIKRCAAPCINAFSEEKYMENIAMARDVLRGQYSTVLTGMKKQMNEKASILDFEGAQKLKEKVERLENYQSRSTVVSTTMRDVDVFSIVSDTEAGYVNYLRVVRGAVVQSYTMELKKCMDETDETLLTLAVVEIRRMYSSGAKEVLLPFPLDVDLGENVRLTVPKISEKRVLVELSEKNARLARMEKVNKERIVDPEAHTRRLMQTMKEELQLDVEPRHIECFDNSNIQGTNPVSSCVVFKDGRPSKKDYRHFIVKTVVGADDFATMAEVITRRYTRLRDENEPLPQLIIVDGGKGQLSSAYQILKDLGLDKKIAIIGIAKRLEELFYPEDPVPLYLDKRSPTLRVIQQLRDEAHRFGITHHRNRRSKGALVSQLDGIKGVGEKTKETLLRHFKTVEKIKTSTAEELSSVVGESKAKIIHSYFSEKKDEAK